MELFDFNNSNGVVSNPIQFNYTGQYGPYGASFSPDNSKLYSVNYSDAWNTDTSYLFQYDLSSGVASQILTSKTLIHKDAGGGVGYLGELQISPDGKIYAAVYYTDTMAVISNPNALGIACNYQNPALVLPKTSANIWGLPNFIDANQAGIHINLPDIQLCTTFTVSVADAGAGYASYQWNTGATSQTISVSVPGQYWVTVTDDNGCQKTDTLGAYVLVPQKEDTVACDTYHADVIQGGVLQYSWFDGTHLATHDFTQSGNYFVDIAYVNGCGIRDSFNLTVVQSPQTDLGTDTSFCKGNVLLDASCNTCTYQWSTGQTTSTIEAKTAGIYWVKVIDANGCIGSDTLVVKPQLTAFNFVMPNIVTPNGDNINDEVDFGKHQFSIFTIEIYNRWGQKIFSSDDPATVWRPTGDEGTYFYTAHYRIDCGVDSRSKEIKGFITLTR
jgi:gliding motility-associated-like protein